MNKLWIAKPEPGASEFAERLVNSGMKKEQLLMAPVMEIASPKTLPHFCGALLETLDALLITSPHALRYVAQYVVLKHMPAYVVGARAEEVLRELGHEGEIFTFEDSVACLDALRDVPPPNRAAQGLHSSTPPQGGSGFSLLYLSGEHVAREVEEPFEAMGIVCERVITYRQAAAQTLPDALIDGLRSHSITHVTLTSPRIALLCSTLAQRYGGVVGEITALCQSEQIAKVAEGVGFELQHIATEPTGEAMVELVAEVVSAEAKS